jgi:hypothetical protein
METGDLLLFGTFLHADQRLLAGGNQRSSVRARSQPISCSASSTTPITTIAAPEKRVTVRAVSDRARSTPPRSGADPGVNHSAAGHMDQPQHHNLYRERPAGVRVGELRQQCQEQQEQCRGEPALPL